ncbi:MAG: permease [Endomicrobia bacterium]|nr:permease [Endomicrobiia bacterium]
MNFITNFVTHLKYYILEILPILAIGFLLSGVFYELVPDRLVNRFLVKKNFFTLFTIIIVGMMLPICCIGSLPIAVGFRHKGVKLGNILAFLVATPATSITAVLMTIKFFGVGFTLYICLSVMILGFLIGIIGNIIDKSAVEKVNTASATAAEFLSQFIPNKTLGQKIISILRYSFVYMPKEIGIEILIGLVLASLISSMNIIKIFVENFLSGIYGYLFSAIFGVLMYICATASVPLVYALNKQGLGVGPSVMLLILGPLTSYATLLVIKKEFGLKTLVFYVITIILFSAVSGYIFSIL